MRMLVLVRFEVILIKGDGEGSDDEGIERAFSDEMKAVYERVNTSPYDLVCFGCFVDGRMLGGRLWIGLRCRRRVMRRGCCMISCLILFRLLYVVLVFGLC